MSKVLGVERQVAEPLRPAHREEVGGADAGNAANVEAMAGYTAGESPGLLAWAEGQGGVQRPSESSGTCGLFDDVGHALDGAWREERAQESEVEVVEACDARRRATPLEAKAVAFARLDQIEAWVHSCVLGYTLAHERHKSAVEDAGWVWRLPDEVLGAVVENVGLGLVFGWLTGGGLSQLVATPSKAGVATGFNAVPGGVTPDPLLGPDLFQASSLERLARERAAVSDVVADWVVHPELTPNDPVNHLLDAIPPLAPTAATDAEVLAQQFELGMWEVYFASEGWVPPVSSIVFPQPRPVFRRAGPMDAALSVLGYADPIRSRLEALGVPDAEAFFLEKARPACIARFSEILFGRLGDPEVLCR